MGPIREEDIQHAGDGSHLRIAIVHARWNKTVVNELVDGARKSLAASKVSEQNIVIQDVPGSFELPWAVEKIGKSTSRDAKPRFDAIIAVGVLVKGETMHFEYIADATSQALMRVQSVIQTPVIFGLLTVLSEQQAMARAGLLDGTHNHGESWGSAAVELGLKTQMWSEGRFD